MACSKHEEYNTISPNESLQDVAKPRFSYVYPPYLPIFLHRHHLAQSHHLQLIVLRAIPIRVHHRRLHRPRRLGHFTLDLPLDL